MNTPPAKRQCTAPPGVQRKKNTIHDDPIVVGISKKNVASAIFSGQLKGRRNVTMNPVDLSKYTLIKDRVNNMLESFEIFADELSLWKLIITIGILDIFTTSRDADTFVNLASRLMVSVDITYNIDLNKLYRLHATHDMLNRFAVAKRVLSRYIQQNTDICSHTSMTLAEIFISYLKPRACMSLDSLF